MSLNCEETYKLMQDYLDRELSQEEVQLVQEHLAWCGMCAEEYVFEDSVLRRVRQCLADTEIPEDLFARVSAALDRA